jgi:sugar phosphate isomerase/epimerase
MPGRECQWIIDKTAELGLSPLYLSTRWFKDEEAAQRAKEYAGERGMTLLGGGQADFVSGSGEWEDEKDSFVQQLRIAKALGASAMAVVHSGALVHNHFSKDPPVTEQIRRMIQHFGELVLRAEEVGVVMAFENHFGEYLQEFR